MVLVVVACRLPKNCCYPSALVLAPSRELVQQVHAEASRMVHKSHLKAVAVTGGETIADQVWTRASLIQQSQHRDWLLPRVYAATVAYMPYVVPE